MRERNLYWPAVSHNCRRKWWLFMVKFLPMKSMPTVAWNMVIKLLLDFTRICHWGSAWVWRFCQSIAHPRKQSWTYSWYVRLTQLTIYRCVRALIMWWIFSVKIEWLLKIKMLALLACKNQNSFYNFSNFITNLTF